MRSSGDSHCRFRPGRPFYFLDPAFEHTGGYRWWARRLRELIEAVGIEAVAARMMCVEHFPYKSVRYTPLGVTLPSQLYSFGLVREAIRQEKQIVIMRSERIWLESVPELRSYPYIRLSNHQNPYLSRARMTEGEFGRMIAALRAVIGPPLRIALSKKAPDFPCHPDAED